VYAQKGMIFISWWWETAIPSSQSNLLQ